MELLLLQSVLVISVYGLRSVESTRSYEIDGFKYYSTYPETMQWYHGLRFCAYHGMYLIDIRTYFEQERITKIIQKHHENKVDQTLPLYRYWTSATNLGHRDNDFYFITTGEPVFWQNWLDGHPPGGETDICITFSYSTKENTTRKWTTSSCNDAAYVMCRNTVDIPFGIKNPDGPQRRKKKNNDN